MKRNHYWKSLFSNNKFPCYVRDIDTEVILYANDEFFKVFDCNETVIGKKFHEVVILDEMSYTNIKNSLTSKHDYEFGFFHNRSNQNYRGYATLMENGTTVFCEFRILLDDEIETSFDKAVTRCMEIYQQPADTILISFMELLCNFYDCERAYVYRFNFEDNRINCVCQWCEDTDFQVPQDIGSKIDSTYLIHLLEMEHEEGIVSANRDDANFDHESTISHIMSMLQMRNVTLCTVEDVAHKIVGLVGISNQKDCSNFFDRRLIHTISRFVAQDVSKGVMDATLFQLHHIDGLTGLYNRVGYTKRMEKLTETKHKTMGVISVNINGLKYINENAGIEGGDKHITASAKRLKDHFDYEFFRMSGDEFLGIAPDIPKGVFEANVVALYDSMKKENNFDFSMGHAWGIGNYEMSKLMFEADTIMYINKQEYYSKSNRQFDSVNDTTLSDLLSYLADREFMVYLQAQVLLEDGSLYGAEALIRRYDKKNKKIVFPDQFIPMYEQKSVIRHVDMFVVEEVCALLQQWCKEGRAIPISVNLSRVTLQEYGVVNTIEEICDRYQVPHHLLVIEVTERVGLIENNVASSLIFQLKDKGFRISLDDFGCAYSNIVTLAQIEVDEVKIDKSLVDHVITNTKNRVLVKNVLAMCNELEGTSTLAEGIEEEEQAKLLHDLGCHLGQGYFYSRPIPVDEFKEKYML